MSNIPNYKELLKDFPPDREQRLRDIKRYLRFEVFFYRPTVWHHSLRVFFMLNELYDFAKEFLPEFDLKKAQTLALIHDDAEIITGDIQHGYKMNMTKDQLKSVEENEESAIVKLSEMYPKKINGYLYKDLLYNSFRKDTLEAQIVAYADKLDAYCECLHEVLGGNISVLIGVIIYVDVIKGLPLKFPLLRSFFDQGKTPFTTTIYFRDQSEIYKENYLYLGKPHSKESVIKETDFVIYNKWKSLVLDNLGKEGMGILTSKIEAF